jgi:hypothetical protein
MFLVLLHIVWYSFCVLSLLWYCSYFYVLMINLVPIMSAPVEATFGTERQTLNGRTLKMTLRKVETCCFKTIWITVNNSTNKLLQLHRRITQIRNKSTQNTVFAKCACVLCCMKHKSLKLLPCTCDTDSYYISLHAVSSIHKKNYSYIH